MTYSQKYAIVHFFEPVNEGDEFHMDAWPLHITIADVFAVSLTDDLIKALATHLGAVPALDVYADREDVLGLTEVVLVKKDIKIQSFHEDLIKFLEANGAIFNTPDYNNEGFLPHSTIQRSRKINLQDTFTLDSLSIIDMFPDGDWQQRKVIKTIQLS